MCQLLFIGSSSRSYPRPHSNALTPHPPPPPVPCTQTACDDGDLCTDGDQCDGRGGCIPGRARTCRPDAPCDRAVCENGRCRHSPAPLGTVCRRATPHGCDRAEVCTGTSLMCPADTGDVCPMCGDGIRDEGEDCDARVVIGDGQTSTVWPKCCNHTTCKVLDQGTQCRPSDPFACVMASVCDGEHERCPAAVIRDNATPCADLNPCTRNDTCRQGICVGLIDHKCTVSLRSGNAIGRAGEDAKVNQFIEVHVRKRKYSIDRP